MDRSAWDERYRTDDPWGSAPNAFVQEVTEPLAPGRALDVAAGDGRHTLWLARGGWEVDAVDFSAVAMARGEHLAAEQGVAARTHWHVADVVAEPLPPGPFDLVVVAYLQLPPAPLAAALTAACARVAAGGTAVLVGHDVSNLRDGVGGPQDATVLWAADDVAAAAREAGLAVSAATVRERAVPGADRPARDAVVVARRPA
ncbi:MAG: class I SAM-dependent methyltransferase [Actinotalea sp.]|nr:class I SAM-dependent methyltransferase [Actinotalea sp.]